MATVFGLGDGTDDEVGDGLFETTDGPVCGGAEMETHYYGRLGERGGGCGGDGREEGAVPNGKRQDSHMFLVDRFLLK